MGVKRSNANGTLGEAPVATQTRGGTCSGVRTLNQENATKLEGGLQTLHVAVSGKRTLLLHGRREAKTWIQERTPRQAGSDLERLGASHSDSLAVSDGSPRANYKAQQPSLHDLRLQGPKIRGLDRKERTFPRNGSLSRDVWCRTSVARLSSFFPQAAAGPHYEPFIHKVVFM